MDAALGAFKRSGRSYWGKRQDMMYYKYIDRLVAAFAHEAKSLIDVGSSNAAYLEDFSWIAKRDALDIKHIYQSESVTGIKADFFDWQPVAKYDFACCLQVLEHIPDAQKFAQKLFTVANSVLISVPYKWKAGASKHHIHDPVDMIKLTSWTGRKADYSVVVSEPLFTARNKRLIAYYHRTDEDFDLKRMRQDAHRVA